MACGTLPDWLAGVGIVGALFVSLRLSSKELDARRAAAEDREKDQAHLIAAWPRFTEQGLGTVLLRNGSDEPIYSVEIYGTSGAYDEPPVVYQSPVLEPQQTIDTGAYPPGPYMGEFPPMELAFTDSRGVRWRRISAGGVLLKDDDWRIKEAQRRRELDARLRKQRQDGRSDRRLWRRRGRHR
jgi:hypothetical protein